MGARKTFQAVIQRTAIKALLTVERVQSGVAFNPLDRNFTTDPYPLYKRLREKDPVHRSRLANALLFTRYEDVATILRDGGRFLTDGQKQPEYPKLRERAIREGVLEEGESDTGGSMLRMDPPDHTRLRSLVSRAFTPRTVEALRPRIEELVEEMLAGAEREGRMDVIGDIAYPLPVTVIAEMLGIPTADRDRFKHWSDEIIRTLGFSNYEDARRSRKAGKELRAYLEPIIEQRRREPREDLLSGLAAAEDGGDRLSVDEMYDTVALLLVAGNETTTNLIGNGMLALMRNPGELERLRSDPSLIENAVEELLRYDSPVQITSRFAIEDTDVNGHPVEAYKELLVVLGAANRDPAHFADPDRLDLGRGDVRHLSFGHGLHYCLGAPLARIEGQAAIGAMVQRFPRIRLLTDAPEWGDNLILRGLRSLPVSVR